MTAIAMKYMQRSANPNLLNVCPCMVIVRSISQTTQSFLPNCEKMLLTKYCIIMFWKYIINAWMEKLIGSHAKLK
jgi:hypothetical protein